LLAGVTFEINSSAALDTADQRAGLILLGAMLLSFGFIRFSTRMIRAEVSWWPGNVTPGGLHIHHLVFGIVLLMLAGFLGFVLQPASPWFEILAGVFGIGMGLTLDEFALWLYLDDVYWSPEGRSSVDAVVTAAVLLALGLVATAPFGAERGKEPAAAFWLVVGVNVILVLVTFLKGKLKLALAGVVLPGLALIGAVRLAKPGSWWGRRFYDAAGEGRRGRKHRRAVAREAKRRERWSGRQSGLYDLVGGAPSRPSPREASDGPDLDGP